MRTSKTFLTLFVALVLGFAGQDVWAQETDNVAMAYSITVKDGMSDAFEAAMKQHLTWRKAHGDPWQWNTYMVVVGEDLGTYIIRSGDHNWSDIDSYGVWEAENSVNTHFEATVASYVESASNALSEIDTDLTRMPEEGGEYNLFAVTTFHLKPGMGNVFSDTMKKVGAAMNEHNYPMHFIIGWPGLGSPGPSVNFIMPHKDWAAFKGPEEEIGAFLTRALGEEGAGEIFQSFISTFHSEDSFVALLRRDLSSPSEGM